MSEERATIEIIAPSVEEAVAKGLAELGLNETDIEVEVLDDGSKGLLGIGSRQARVRLVVKGEAGPASASGGEQTWDDDTENTRATGIATVQELLDKMGVPAKVDSRVDVNESPEDFPNIYINITGNDLSYLIGKRAETLNALQFITRLIVGKEIGHAANIIVDVEGYRERRERNLRQMANKMANQAIATGKTQSLEPMTPAERRIIHMELRGNDQVETESVGDGERRKVTIRPV